MNNPRRRALQVFLATVGLGVLCLAIVVYRVATYPNRATGSAHGTVEVEIPRGAGATKVSQLLAEAKLIDHPGYFRWYAGQRGAATRFRPGRYKIEAPATPRQLVDTLVKGVADRLVTVTIPEGKNLIEVAEILAAAGIANQAELVAQATDLLFARSLELPGRTLEGYLYPDTYKFVPGSQPGRVLAAMARRHRQVWEELRGANPTGANFLRTKVKLDDASIVTLASIVEKETGQPQERPRIAQVFINRLIRPSFQPKLLQTDPTIVYGCTVAPLFLGTTSPACQKWDGRIHRIHLDDTVNPYNTYTHEGLPPGPIANPGRAALLAVLRPDGSSYLYFVSKNDGTHHFSATVGEHEAAVVKYQRGGKALP
ncbi:MAG: endolytic transglycosylase MltG [Deltaproteobacteria bacterium]|nr:endolytic transglycosylase MltG [Deltaproteobacteria bacterium]